MLTKQATRGEKLLYKEYNLCLYLYSSEAEPVKKVSCAAPCHLAEVE